MVLPRANAREALLDAAEKLFSERSFAAVGVREIAEQAGVNLALISYHFGSKSDLYEQTVRRTLARRDAAPVWDLLREAPSSRPAAAAALARFIQAFLARLLSEDEHDTCCALIMQEASQPTSAIDCVVNDFIKPHEDMLKRVVRVLRPDASDIELALAAESILGQCLHYRVFRPFMERLRGRDLSSPKRLTMIADHIARFSLRGVGLSETAITRALQSARTQSLTTSVGETSP